MSNGIYLKGLNKIAGLILCFEIAFLIVVFTKSSNSQPNNLEEPCVGYKDCSFVVRQKMEGAGWELAGDVLYYGEGVHYAVGAKPYETGVKKIYYTMDCNCEPLDVRFE